MSATVCPIDPKLIKRTPEISNGLLAIRATCPCEWDTLKVVESTVVDAINRHFDDSRAKQALPKALPQAPSQPRRIGFWNRLFHP